MKLKRPPHRVDPSLKERRREEILDAAVILFAQHGYADTDTQFLADCLQVGKGTLYRYFRTKRELFLAAVDRVMRRLLEIVLAEMAKTDDTLEQIECGIRVFLEYFGAHPEFVELLIQERAIFKDREKPTYMAHREVNVERWRNMYRSLIAAGRIRDMSVVRISDVIGNMLYGTIFTNYFSSQPKPPHEQTRDILDVVFHGILTPSERKRRVAADDSNR